MAKKKRCPKHEEHVDETWLIPYADLLTLLLALFIVLFATSQTDKQKLMEMSKVFSIIFTSQKGVMGDASIQPSNQKHSTDNNEKTSDQGEATREMIPPKQGELATLQKKVNQYINMENLPGYIATSMTDEGLMITIRDIALFPSGGSELLPEADRIAYDLSIMLEKTQEKVQVAGHTDDNPSEGSGYSSNWELSSARAVNFLKAILKNPALDPERFSAVAYSQYQPVAPNISEQDRERNRRVEILIRKAD
ncbi:flagellar motor protein MotB [Seleniivibrio woodruffii]|uniref:flagellar motor protein MotB n=1 Tax=Seleniivibrio woodruffii TaxID=1078050 RepID=UPI0026EE12FC|nr:flagellar motor protein MotB [Seleniivibrio woodruffii]